MLEFKRKKRRAAGACCRCANTIVTVIELIIGMDTLKIKAQPFFLEKKIAQIVCEKNLKLSLFISVKQLKEINAIILLNEINVIILLTFNVL